jgi:L-arabinose isomerase
MKVIIAGSRTIIDMDEVEQAIHDSGFEITEVVCGCARGVDELGLIWGTNNDVPVKRMPADWVTYGRAAGHNRNIEMARYGDALILVWDGSSRGSANMLKVARMQGLKIYERVVSDGR